MRRSRNDEATWHQSIVAPLKRRVRLYDIRTVYDENTEEQARLASLSAALATEATAHGENGKIWRALKLAYYAGLNDGRREILWLREKPLRLGSEQIERGRYGREATKKALHATDSQLLAELKREYELNPHTKRTELQRRVAERHEMSARTLRERLKGKLPR